jgi:F-type H+-transporting ATPase subunit gamma
VSERRAQVRARLATMDELGEVLGAMRGMAAARIQQGERARRAAQEYAGLVGAALANLSRPDVPAPGAPGVEPAPPMLVVALSTERGFVGALNEHVLRAALERAGSHEILLIGARGLALAREQGVAVTYVGSMATHLGGVGAVADQIGDLLSKRLTSGGALVVELVHPRRTSAGRALIERRRLLPSEPPPGPAARSVPPLTMLPALALASQIAGEYVHAILFQSLVETFAAANAASLEVLQAAHAHLDEMLVALRRSENVLRQEEITAEVLEVITGRMQEAP